MDRSETPAYTPDERSKSNRLAKQSTVVHSITTPPTHTDNNNQPPRTTTSSTPSSTKPESCTSHFSKSQYAVRPFNPAKNAAKLSGAAFGQSSKPSWCSTLLKSHPTNRHGCRV
ncbi:hypothetical protein EJ03DRAFT_335360 [Teratosphaeria nubilosa]|uniref:Uncharacterized protein n=1 Tax=Teratosphaeria nubilosa TaxID=161662 RepID=A0A6G1LDF2_9PEZI|nr:hypothetical protein EJ03DRAFT_335360 [Teratosphaeria nubilosa]